MDIVRNVENVIHFLIKWKSRSVWHQINSQFPPWFGQARGDFKKQWFVAYVEAHTKKEAQHKLTNRMKELEEDAKTK